MLYRILIFSLCAGCSISPLYDYEKSPDIPSINVDVIAERDGQKLRGFILDLLRDLNFTNKKYRLTVNLAYVEKPFAFSDDGFAKRVRLSYTANVVLREYGQYSYLDLNADHSSGKSTTEMLNNEKLQKKSSIIFNRNISVFSSSNISTLHGEVALALYGKANDALLKNLSDRIVENIKVLLQYEN